MKFDAEGRVALVLGRKPESISVRPAGAAAARRPAAGGAAAAAAGRRRRRRGGAGGAPAPARLARRFSRPTDVAWDRAGNIYIADGIGNNNRIAKFDKDGHFLPQWGSTGSGHGQFNGVKALAVDAQGNVYVADIGQQAHPGVRRRRQRSSRSSATSARR